MYFQATLCALESVISSGAFTVLLVVIEYIYVHIAGTTREFCELSAPSCCYPVTDSGCIFKIENFQVVPMLLQFLTCDGRGTKNLSLVRTWNSGGLLFKIFGSFSSLCFAVFSTSSKLNKLNFIFSVQKNTDFCRNKSIYLLKRISRNRRRTCKNSFRGFDKIQILLV